MLNNKNFYPTPPNLIMKMLGKVQGKPKKVLDPQAGKGDILDYLKDTHSYNWRRDAEVSAIEIDPVLQATLRGKGIKLIDTDFLAYAGLDKFDLIIMNPPFDNGDQHLLKAIDILYRGEIVCLLNAETLRNPHTNYRKLLLRRLDELGASIEYIKNAFSMAERKTDVETALVYIKIDRKVEDDLFADCDDHTTRAYQAVEDKHEVSTGKTVEELVAEYDRVISVGTETIISFYRNYREVGKYICLNDVGAGGDGHKIHRTYSSDDLTDMMQNAINSLLKSVRTDFWRRTLDLKEVRSRLTKKKQDEFEHEVTELCHMDFTTSNIRQFMLNLIGSCEQTLTEAVLDVFDMFTIRHCWHGNVHEKNIHYFNGWKTNNAFKVGKRVVVPGGRYGRSFTGWSGGWDLDYDTGRMLDDFDKVMSYFDGGKPYVSLSSSINTAFKTNESSGIESTYFRATCHKKGTIHLTFLDEDILRRFNVVACRGKGWLPGDFGAKAFEQLSIGEKQVVESFEGQKSYDKNRNATLFRCGNNSLLSLPEAFSSQVGADVYEAAA